jgi:hypothetical protein
MRGDSVKGYGLDMEGHPGGEGAEAGPHVNWWDYTDGHYNNGRGPGKKGAIPMKLP